MDTNEEEDWGWSWDGVVERRKRLGEASKQIEAPQYQCVWSTQKEVVECDQR